jgi:hypothetical protein
MLGYNKGEKNPMFGKHPSLETRKKISDAHKGKTFTISKPRSEEHLRKLGLSKKGNKYCLGRVLSEETKKKIGDANRGKVHTEEFKKKISQVTRGENNPMFGKHRSDELKKRLSDAQKGNTYRLGKYHTVESKLKMSEGHKNLENIERLKSYLIKKPSKPQLKLFEIIKNNFPDKEVVMEYKIKTKEGYSFIDVAIPNLKIGFEYDEPYWHQDKIKDIRRHDLLRSQGWRVIHFSDISQFGGK